MNNKIKIIALFGEAGSGKDYLYNQVVHWDEEGVLEPMFNRVIKTTTRPKREREVDGVHYHFISIDDFNKITNEGNMTAISVYRDWCYGIETTKLSTDKPNFIILDVLALDALTRNPDFDITIFKIETTPKTRLLRQLNREINPDVNEIVRRFQADKKEYETLSFDYIALPNETLDDANNAVLSILRAGAAAITGQK